MINGGNMYSVAEKGKKKERRFIEWNDFGKG
jgi:hypothetical protein